MNESRRTTTSAQSRVFASVHRGTRSVRENLFAGSNVASPAMRSISGYTMVELIAVIMIIAIMSALAFGSFLTYQKQLQQRELDETAREIFIAAQNHLTTADEMGYTEKLDKGTPESEVVGKIGNGTFQAEQGVYYFSVGADNRESALGSSSLLSQMLPWGAIDETVRNEGTYVIRYDVNSAMVLDVFFAWQKQTGLFSAYSDGFSFGEEDYKPLFFVPDYRDKSGNEETKDRTDYDSEAGTGGTGIIIGYYGGADASGVETKKLSAPTLEVENEERLYAVVTYEPKDEEIGIGVNDDGSNKKSLEPEIDLVVTGETSGRTKTLEVCNFGESSSNYYNADNTKGKDAWYATSSIAPGAASDGKTYTFTYYVLLDDITPDKSNRNNHFAKVFENDDSGGKGLLPGENITVQASIHTSKDFAPTRKSSRCKANSLFASAKADSDEPVAQIENIRHLENLSGLSESEDASNISSFNPDDTRSSAWGSNGGPKTAWQTNDIYWNDFVDDICEFNLGEQNRWDLGAREQFRARVTDDMWDTEREEVRITNFAGEEMNVNTNVVETTEKKECTFWPVVPKFDLAYNGGNHYVSDVVIDIDSGDAGLFGNLSKQSSGSISNLLLKDFKVKTANGSAGALAGTVAVDKPASDESATKITNVAVFNEVSDDSAYEVQGTRSVGGLVGAMTRGSIEQSSASVYVVSATTSNVEGDIAASVAGGLVGSASGVEVKHSYAGGHTAGGKYLRDEDSTMLMQRGRLNVFASGSAGGLVGSAYKYGDTVPVESTDIAQCYSTTSVHGNNVSGGIVGFMQAQDEVTVSDSYTVGLVHRASTETATAGVFAGSIPTYGGTRNSYSELGCELTVDGDNPVAPAEKDRETYENFVGKLTTSENGDKTARPYDELLRTKYKEVYPFKTIAELANTPIDQSNNPEQNDSDDSALDESRIALHLKSHYGDWPAIETFVVNESS